MTDLTRIIGIDPGLHGAFCMVEYNERDEITRYWVEDTPHMDHHGDQLLDVAKVVATLRTLPEADLCIIEEPLRATNGKSSIRTSSRTLQLTWLNFGRFTVAIEKVCEQWHSVTPRIWKSAMGLSSIKETSLELARLIYPESEGVLDRKKDHDRAEALLLAEYARWHLIKGEPVFKNIRAYRLSRGEMMA